MENILCKRDFYRMMLSDRLPVAQIEFPFEKREGRISFFSTPLGTVLLAELGKGTVLREVKLYDRKRGNFVCPNAFCGDELIELECGSFVSVSSRLQIEDIIGREFLIKADDLNVVARAEMLPKRTRKVDKIARLVYN